jgi:D-glycero-beta-D-manno-heptose 1-phosphate adenylyltransferase
MNGAPPSPLPASLAQKVLATSSIGAEGWRRPLVFTNGVFDVLHPGHVSYLAAARALGATLLVAVNTDASARQLGKGPGRPLNSELDRLVVVAALESVSYAVLFEEPDPCALITRCRPDLYVKGGDYDMERLAETALVRSWGGRSLGLPFVAGYSTSELARRIRALPG